MTIDDELYLSIRIRVPQGMDSEQQGDLAAKVLNSAAAAIPKADWPDVYMAGFEATYATWRELPDTEGQVMHFTRDKGNGDG
jgi:hypothetical protein